MIHLHALQPFFAAGLLLILLVLISHNPNFTRKKARNRVERLRPHQRPETLSH